MKKLFGELKAALPTAGERSNHGGDDGRGAKCNHLSATKKQTLQRRINQMKAAIKHKWVPGGLCSTHGHGVGQGHTSDTCNPAGQQIGHITTATRANPIDPGAKKNKGWDNWIVNAF